MEDVIELDQWSSYIFRTDNKIYQLGRLCGYMFTGSGTEQDTARVVFIVTEPISRVDPVEKVVITADNKKYKLYTPAADGTGQKMDMMYAISRWSDQNQKSSGRETTKEVLYYLGAGTEEEPKAK